MKLLIIGGTGLISTSMTCQLLEQGGCDLTLYNRGKTEPRIPAGVKTIHGDRKDFSAFEAQMAEAGPFDCVIDMCCYEPEEAASVVQALKGRTGQYVFCSTIDVYQKPATHYPYREDEPYGGLNAYSTNKVHCEQTLTAAHQRGDLPVTIIRPAYTYGDSRGILHPVNWNLSYLDRIRRGKPIAVHGDGSSLWVACHVDDVAGAFIGAIGNPKTYGKSYHTTGEEWLTWTRYHQLVAEALGAPEPTLVYIPTELLVKVAPKHTHLIAENFQFNNIFDNSAAHADLGFRYTVPWLEGVRRTVAWLDTRHMIPNSDDDPFEDHLIAAWQQAGTAMAQAAVGLED